MKCQVDAVQWGGGGGGGSVQNQYSPNNNVRLFMDGAYYVSPCSK